MKNKDRSSFSGLSAIVVVYLMFMYQTNLKAALPFLKNGIVFLIVALIVGTMVSIIVFRLLPKPKKKEKSKKKTTSKKINSNTKSTKRKLSDTELLKTDLFIMEGTDFERLCFLYFKDHGYNPKETRATGDHGVDLVIRDPKDGMMIAVQCKRWKDTVGNRELRDLEAGKRAYKCIGTLFITTSSFSTPAKEYADSVRMDLWSGFYVKEKIGKWQKEKLKKIS